MNSLKKLKILLSLVSINLILGCASAPPDVPVCAEISKDLGWCTYTVSNQEFYLDNESRWLKDSDGVVKPWKQVNREALKVPAYSWAMIKAYILKNCKKNNECLDVINNIENKTDQIDNNLYN